MKCLICDNSDKYNDEIVDDCVIDFLEKIKIHYMSIKGQLNESEESIKDLKAINTDLLQTIEKLKTDLTQGSPIERKKRKTDSFDSLPSSQEYPNVLAVLPDKSTDDLNEAISVENWDDTFFAPPTQTVEKPEEILPVKPTKISPDILKKGLHQNTYQVPNQNKNPWVLSSKAAPVTPLKRSPEESVLPRRDKLLSTKKVVLNDENKNTLNASKWITKEQSVKKNAGGLEKCWNISFLQPVKSDKNNSFVNLSPNKSKENKSPGRANKLRQTRLNFSSKNDKNPAVLYDDSLCEEIIAASPTSLNATSNEPVKLSKMLSLRNIARQKSDTSTLMSSNKKTRSQSPEHSRGSFDGTPMKCKVKAEPITGKKTIKMGLLPRLPLSPVKGVPDSPQCSQDDSSVFVLPSQPDDVICLEESEDLQTSTVDLLKDMIIQDDPFSDLLREAEMSRLNQTETDKNLASDKIVEKNNDDEPKTPATQRKLPVFDCKECETYFKYIGKNLTNEEIQRRLRNCCRHKKPINLHHTPEGFWDPCFRPLSPDDPRNETLIDTRFIDKR